MVVVKKAVHLLKAAFGAEEDRVWTQLAEERDAKSARFVSHQEAWVTVCLCARR